MPQDRTASPDLLSRPVVHRADWDEKDTLIENYARNKLVADPNKILGRKEKATPLVPPEQRKEAGEDTFSDDDGGSWAREPGGFWVPWHPVMGSWGPKEASVSHCTHALHRTGNRCTQQSTGRPAGG